MDSRRSIHALLGLGLALMAQVRGGKIRLLALSSARHPESQRWGEVIRRLGARIE